MPVSHAGIKRLSMTANLAQAHRLWNLGSTWNSESFADLSCRQCARKAHASRILMNLVYSRQTFCLAPPVEPRGRNLSLPQNARCKMEFRDTLYWWCCLHSWHIFSKTGFIDTDPTLNIVRGCMWYLLLSLCMTVMYCLHLLRATAFSVAGVFLCDAPPRMQNHIVKQEFNTL